MAPLLRVAPPPPPDKAPSTTPQLGGGSLVFSKYRCQWKAESARSRCFTSRESAGWGGLEGGQGKRQEAGKDPPHHHHHHQHGSGHVLVSSLRCVLTHHTLPPTGLRRGHVAAPRGGEETTQVWGERGAGACAWLKG